MKWLDSVQEFYEPRLLFAGQLTRPYVLNYEESCICGGISFQPWAGNVLFNIPADHFRDQVIDMSAINADNMVIDQFAECGNATTLFDCFEKYLDSLIKKVRIDPMVMSVGRALSGNPNSQTLNKVLKQISLSKRRIEQRFSETAGLSLSVFMKKLRFQKAVRLMTKFEEGKLYLKDLSCQLDYYDQSHFIRDFKQFSGLTPKEYLKNKTRLIDFFGTLTQPTIHKA